MGNLRNKKEDEPNLRYPDSTASSSSHIFPNSLGVKRSSKQPSPTASIDHSNSISASRPPIYSNLHPHYPSAPASLELAPEEYQCPSYLSLLLSDEDPHIRSRGRQLTRIRVPSTAGFELSSCYRICEFMSRRWRKVGYRLPPPRNMYERQAHSAPIVLLVDLQSLDGNVGREKEAVIRESERQRCVGLIHICPRERGMRNALAKGVLEIETHGFRGLGDQVSLIQPAERRR
jgi:hypothetical protein